VKGTTCVVGACWAFCENASSTCPGVSATCGPAYTDTAAIPGMFVCTRTCNPAQPTLEDATFDACGPGVGCYPSANGDSYCAGPTTAAGTQGATCADNLDCAPGYFCTDGGYCAKYCLVASPSCPPSNTCYSFSSALLAGHEEIGFCDL
jgi:hypothetical protein